MRPGFCRLLEGPRTIHACSPALMVPLGQEEPATASADIAAEEYELLN